MSDESPDPARRLVERAAGRSGGGDVAVAIERDRAHRVMRAHGAKLVGHLQVALLLGFAQPHDLALDDQLFVGAQLDAVLLGEPLGARSDEVNVRALGQHLLGRADRIADVLHAAHAAGAQRRAVHHQGIELHPAIHVEEGAAAGVKGLVLFHGDHRRFDGVETTAAALQHLPALAAAASTPRMWASTIVIGNCPGAAMDQHYRINRQVRPFFAEYASPRSKLESITEARKGTIVTIEARSVGRLDM